MTLRDALRVGVLVCVLCALAAFGVAESQPVLALTFCASGGVGWWMTEWRPARTPGVWAGLPRWLTNLLLLVIVGCSVFNAVTTRALVTVFATLLASVLIVKLWQQRRGADYGQILTMSLFLTVAAVLSDNSVTTGVMVLIETPVMAACAMMYQVWRAGTGARDRHAQHLAWRRLRLPLGAACVLSLAVGAAIASAVFVFMPRGYLLPQFRSFARPSVGRTVGFTDQIDLSAGAPQQESTVVVMLAQVRSASDTESLGNADEPAYLRGAVLDTYEHGRWWASRAAPGLSLHQTLQPHGANSQVQQNTVSVEGRQFVNTRTVIQPRVSVADPSQAFSVGRGYRWEFSEPTEVDLDLRYGCLAYSNRGLMSEYRVDCAQVPFYPELSRRGLVSFPDQKVQAFAAKVLREQGIEPDPAGRDPADDVRAARVFEAYLRANYTYSRRAGLAPIEHPVSWFLETEKQGHCEFFASALAALCRSVGIDANVVAGYLSTEYDREAGPRGEGAYLVRASDAHAWVEVNTEPGIWRTFDATPESSSAYRSIHRGEFATAVDRILWAIEDVWNARVVSYDKSTQERLLRAPTDGGIAGVITSLFEGSRLDHARVGARAIRPMVPLVLPLLVLAGLLYGLAKRSRHRRAWRRGLIPGWALSGAHPEVVKLHRHVVATLARYRCKPGAGEPLGVALQRADLPPSAKETLQSAVHLLYEACFAGRADTASLAEARRRLHAL
ncbi:MAG: DUF3488 and transglutaminase-like domain-containing protein [Phycisphaerales bacterium]